MKTLINRRNVLGAGVALSASLAHAQDVQTRLPWSAFKASPHAHLFADTVLAMQRNTNVQDPASWSFWANVHQNHCPHGQPYFLAWHRGYLALFEAKLRELSGNDQWRLPYWDYYAGDEIPDDFKTSGGDNPLYLARKNTSVRGALSSAPFAPNVTHFPFGPANAFERLLEGKPHNQVHNLIGEIMATFQSPRDPIFWLHHANIDRLWTAWIGQGHSMPASSDAYWSGDHLYADGLGMERARTRDIRALGYRYLNEDAPRIIADEAPVRPARASGQGALQSSPGQPARRPLILGERSFSVNMRREGALASSPGEPARALELVLDDVRATEAGGDGGYFYEIYLNLPDFNDPEARASQHLLARLGAFEIATAAHAHDGHTNEGVRITTPVSPILNGLGDEALRNLAISFVRVSGENAPIGAAIEIGDARLASVL